MSRGLRRLLLRAIGRSQCFGSSWRGLREPGRWQLRSWQWRRRPRRQATRARQQSCSPCADQMHERLQVAGCGRPLTRCGGVGVCGGALGVPPSSPTRRRSCARSCAQEDPDRYVLMVHRRHRTRARRGGGGDCAMVGGGWSSAGGERAWGTMRALPIGRTSHEAGSS